MTLEPTASALPAPPAPVQRLISLDALRGFDMCWILGLAEVVKIILEGLNVPGRDKVIDQLEHVDWAGFHFEDLIFPLFLFIAGVSLAIVLPRRVEKSGVFATAARLVVRAAVLYAIGVIYSGGFGKGLEEVRWMGVLQRIALGSLGGGLLFLWLSPRGLKVVLVAILVGYWALLTFVPVPGIGIGHYGEGENLANYLDKTYLPGHKYDGDHDPEGLLSTLPAIATALLGILAGCALTGPKTSSRKVAGLLIAGTVMLAAGWAWHPYFPVVKKLWTSSIVLVAGGYSALLLAAFYGIVEVAGFKVWTRPFVWVGANPILLYFCHGMGFFSKLAGRFVPSSAVHGEWLRELVSFGLVLLVARYLYRRGIYVRA